MIKSFLLLSLAFALTARAAWAAAPTDLGQGLLYCRVHALPADLPAANTGKFALVVDLRYTLTDDTGATAFSAWLGFRTAAHPVFILVNAGTGTVLLHVLAARPMPSGVVALGPPLPAFTPNMPLKISPDTERRAFDALDHGTAIESLVAEKTDKPRYDEASMVKEHASNSEQPAPDDTAADKLDSAKAKPTPPPLIDLALQRAVQLHRALLALHMIPRT